MKIALDIQPMQTEHSRNRGIGFYNLNLFKYILTLDSNENNNNYTLLHTQPNFIFENTGFANNYWMYFGPFHLGIKSELQREIGKNLMRKFLRDFDVELFHFTSPFDDVDIFYQEWYKDYKTIATVYDLIPLIFNKHYLCNPEIKAWYMRRLEFLKSVDRFVAISNSVKNDMVNFLGILDKQIDVIYAGVDSDFKSINVAEKDIEKIKISYGITKPFIMCTGGVDFRKNIEGLIEAYSLLPQVLRNKFQLVIVCKVTDSEAAWFRTLAEKFDLQNQLILTNFVPKKDLILLYNIATIFAFPSKYEGFGLPVLEALSCGLPVLASNVSSIPEIVGDAGILVNPDSVEDIAKGITRLLEEPNLRDELKFKAIEQSKKFSWQKTSELLLESYSKLRQVDPGRNFIEKIKKRIAFFSPLRPINSGISDYSEELLKELKNYYDIDLIIDDYTPSNAFIKAHFNIINAIEFQPQKYETIIYQIGNSTYHTYMFPFMEVYPGITVLHDANLHGLMYHIGISGKKEVYINEMEYCYGELGKEEAIQVLSGQLPPRFEELSLLQRVIDNSKAIIVHSRMTSGNLAVQYSNIPIYYVPMGVDPVNVLNSEEKENIKKSLGYNDHLIIGTFGIIAPSKRIRELIVAYAESLPLFQTKTKLLIVGQCDESYKEELNRCIKDLRLESNILIAGEVSKEKYDQYLMISDIAVSLRYPHKGETSAALIRAISAAKPIIVTNIGTLGQIPDDFSIKVSYNDQEILTIKEALVTLVNDVTLREKMSNKALGFFRENHLVKQSAYCYKEIIDLQERVSINKKLDSSVITRVSEEYKKHSNTISRQDLNRLARLLMRLNVSVLGDK
ncbi:glycosyltransferase [Fodinisporobacter ferrooxydans]|uniref:Glycosyltransferase n=1 Tax=Fodinisporobacter ferrooxydans TaxID=2901836 RepID=A0ABY4CLV1_9BACL|nr:glycosyltransferase [Alicyclobacillaceae bacterium MYW30-H2]